MCIHAHTQNSVPQWIKDFNFSVSFFNNPEYKDSILNLTESYTKPPTAGYKEKIAFYVVMTMFEGENGSKDTALHYFERLLPYVHSTQTGIVITRTYWAIGRIYYLKSQFSEAIRYFMQQDYYAEKYQLRKEQMRANYYISSCFLEMRNFPVSHYYIFRATQYSLEMKDTFNIIRCLFSLTNNFSAEGNMDSAMYYLDQAHQFITPDDIEHEAYYYSLKGNLFTLQGSYDLARSYQQKALSMFEKIQDGFGLVQVTENLGTAYLAMGKNDSAFIYLKRAEEINGDDIYGNSITLYDGLYRLYKAKNNSKMALNYLEEWVKQDSTVRKFDIDYIRHLKDSFVLEKNALILENDRKNIQALYSQRTQFTIYISLAAFGIFILFVILLYYRYKNRKEKEKNQIISQLNEIKMRAFQSQMNPHFVFNCLATIDSYILQNRRHEASAMMESFARLIRTVLENSKQDWVEVENDIKALRTYLELERIRADKSFDFEIDFPDFMKHLFIPPLIIQPIVENAIIHGVREVPDGQIKVQLRLEGNYLITEISDNGKGRKNPLEKKSDKSSLGISVTMDRLKLMDPGSRTEYIIYTDLTDPSGTVVKIFVPYKTKQDLS